MFSILLGKCQSTFWLVDFISTISEHGWIFFSTLTQSEKTPVHALGYPHPSAPNLKKKYFKR